MKTIILQRNKSTENSVTGTEGQWIFNNIKICDTLELHEENNKPKESHIPEGEYLCKIVQSPKFGKVYQVCNVPGRGNILIHSGNLAGDTDQHLKSDVLGCILLGNGYGLVGSQRGILNSRRTLKLFMDSMGGLSFKLKIIN